MKRFFGLCDLFILISCLGMPGFSPAAFAGSGPTTLANPLPTAFNYYYGNTVALTPDGSLAVVGADSGGYGFDTPPAVYVFQYANGAWNTTPIISICDPAASSGCSGDTAPTSLFGSTVAVSGISNNSFIVIVGAPGGDVVNGSPVAYGVAYVYQCTLSGTPACTLASQIGDPQASSTDQFGSAVTISTDGNTALVGAWGTTEPGGAGVNNNPEPGVGAAYLYSATGGAWAVSPPVSATLNDPAPTCAVFGSPPYQQTVCDEFGYAVALAATGSNTLTALVGAPGAVEVNNGSPEPGEGQTFIFGNSSGSWQLTQTLTDPNTVACSGVVQLACDEFGDAVALSADGTVALVGAPNAVVPVNPVSGEAGVANLYIQSGGNWNSTPATFANPDVQMNSIYTGKYGFGWSLSASNSGGSIAVTIGNPGATEGANNGGYGGTGEVDTYSCTESPSLSCGTAPQSILVDPALSPSSPSPVDYFGTAVAMSSNASVLLAGAPNTTGPAPNSSQNNGAAYVYGTPGPQVPPTPVQLTINLSGPNNVTVNAGQNLAYGLTVTNTSTSESAVNVVFAGTLAAGVTLVTDSPNGAICSASGSSYSCALGSLGPGASWTPSVTVQIGSSDVGQTVVAASISVMASNSSNNPSVTASVTVAQATSSLSIYYQPLAEGLISGNTPACTAFDNNGNCLQAGMALVCANTPGASCPMLIEIHNTSSTQSAVNVGLVVTIPQGVTVYSVTAGPGLCVQFNSNSLSCGLGTLPPGYPWVIIFNEIIDSTDQNGQTESSQVTATAANTPATTQSYDFTVGTPTMVTGSNTGSGALDWLEIAALVGLLWLGRWRKKRLR